MGRKRSGVEVANRLGYGSRRPGRPWGLAVAWILAALMSAMLAAPAARAGSSDCSFNIAAGKGQGTVAYLIPTSDPNSGQPIGAPDTTCDASDFGILDQSSISTTHSGTASEDPNGGINGIQDEVTYHPAAGYSGTDTFTIIGDNGGSTGTVTVRVLALSPSQSTVTQNVALSGEALNVSGGVGAYSSFSKTGGSLPTGVTLNSNGTLTGTPTSTGTFNFTVTFTSTGDATSGAQSVTTTASLTVNAASTPTVTSVGPTSGPATGGTSVTVGGTGFTGATAVRFGGTAATSFTINSDTRITATSPPHAAGTVDTTVVAPGGTSATGGADHFTFTAVSVSPSSLPAGTAGGAYSQTVSASGGVSPYNFTITAGTLPAGLNLNSSTGAVSGTPTAGGAFNFTVTATDSASATGARAYSLTVSAPTIAISPASLPAGTEFTAYSQTVSGSGGTAPYSFAVTSGALPGGLSLNTSTGVLSGTPTANGVFNFTITATDSSTGTGPYTGSRAYSLPVGAPAAPTVTNVSPTSGPASGGTSVTITGTGFTGATAVSFGGAVASSFTVNSPTQITATAPAGSAGTVDITVTTPGGTSSTSSADQFTFIAAPAVTGVSPSSGPTAGGTSVTITGTGFTGATAVQFGGAAASSFTVVSATQITATAPAGSGTVDITVTTTGGTSATGGADHLTYVAAPSVTSASPTTGPASGGTSVTITGTGFTGATAVSFGGSAASSFTVNNATQITATAPAGSGTVDITVTTTGGTSATGGGDHFTYTNISIAPATLPAATVGAAYSQTMTASGGINPYSFAISAGSLPAGLSLNSSTGVLSGTPTAGGAFNFTITVTDHVAATGHQAYSLTVNAPTITLSPASLAAATEFTAYSQTVTASGGTSVYSFAVTSGSLPAGLSLNGATGVLSGAPTANGVFNFTITSTDSSTGTGPFTGSRGYSLSVGTPTAPTVASVSPTSGPATGGTSIAITGTGFTGATAVSFGGTAASGFIVNSATQITATAPAGSGTVDVTVTTPGGTSPTGAGDHFTFVAAPAVTSVSPASGPVAGGTSVTITGTNLTGATAVKFGGSAASGFVVNSATQITATAPAGSGTVDITITTIGGTSATSAADRFTYVGGPAVSGVTPASGPASGGTSVTLTGTNLAGATAVKFGGTAASGFVVSSTTQITATAPAGSGTVDITVTTIGGTSTTSAADRFAYVAAPAVSAVSPASGPATGGTHVTLTGTGFSGATAVSFGGTAASSFTVNSATQISATAPAGSGTVDVRVAGVGGTSATGAGDRFTYTAISLSPASPLPAGAVGVVYGQSYSASGGVAPYSFAATAGALPAGLTLAAAGGLSGTPTAGGVFNFTVTATDQAHASHGQAYSLTINAARLAISPTSLPAATQAANYSQAITATGGTAPYRYSVTAGALPAGLSLSPTGGLGGSPTASGLFNFTVTAIDSSTGAGPYSAPRAYSLTVNLPPAPSGAARSVSVPYGSAGQAIDLSGSITGLATSVTISQAPGHGQATAAGETVTYVPAPGYAGPDSFSYVANGPGGASAAALVSISVVAPAPVAVADTATTPANQPVTIQAAANDTGPVTSLVVTAQPAHGQAQVNGLAITYTPATDFFGADSFAYKAVGPGGSSAPATDTLTVTALAPPAAPPVTSTDVNTAGAGTTVTIPITPTGTPPSSGYTIAIATPPAHGHAVINGHNIIYTANPGFAGQDPFTYTISDVFGVSQPAQVTVTVTLIPVAQALTASTPALTPVTVDVTAGATGGPFASAHVLSVSPVNAGTATVASTTQPGHLTITFTPSTQFSGQVVVNFTLSNLQQTSAPSTLTITVAPRPDPTLNPDVKGLIGAEGDAARRFAETQLANFNHRLEQLHHPGGQNAGGYQASNSFGLSLGLGDYADGGVRHDTPDDHTRRWSFADADFLGQGGLASAAAGGPGGRAPGLAAAPGPGSTDARQTLPGGFAVWAAGTVDLGQRRVTPGQAGTHFQTDGLSFGVDRAFGDRLVLGVGAGWGDTLDSIGVDGTRLRADNWVGAFYGSLNPIGQLYLDGVVGYGGLDFDTRRPTAGAVVTGTRHGEETFGSLTAAWEIQDGRWRLSPYSSIDLADARLDPYVEVGDPVWALAYGRETVKLVTGSLGLHGDYLFQRSWGDFSPHLRIEYQHDFNGSESVDLRYADLIGGTLYTLQPNLLTTDNLVFGLGGDWRLKDGWSLSLDWENTGVGGQETSDRYVFKASKRF